MSCHITKVSAMTSSARCTLACEKRNGETLAAVFGAFLSSFEDAHFPMRLWLKQQWRELQQLK